jgi:hypothetical protein
MEGRGMTWKTYILALGVIDVKAAPMSSPVAAIKWQNQCCRDPAQASEANGGVILRKPTSSNKKAQGKECLRLQLDGYKHSQSISSGWRQVFHMATA